MKVINRKSAKQRPALYLGKILSWVKLPNSGDPLKFIIPSYNWKIISGISNDNGKVITYEMNENEMGYRGTKSQKISINLLPILNLIFIQIEVLTLFLKIILKIILFTIYLYYIWILYTYFNLCVKAQRVDGNWCPPKKWD